jgi:Terminase small subunit
MPILTNSRLEKFAQLPAGAKFRPSEAYRQCGYTSKNADVNCQDLLANPSVAARIAEPMAGNAQECKMTRKEALDWLVGSDRDWLARRSLPLLLSPPTSAISAVNSSAFIRPTSQYS